MVDPELEAHREGDRHLDVEDDGEVLPGLARLLAAADVFDDEPTHEKWRRGRPWR